MPEAVIVDAVRTPRGKRKGSLRNVHPVDLLTTPLRAVVERNGIDPKVVDDVVMGCVTETGEQGMCIARGAVMAAGLPEEVPGVTLNRFCGSGQQAVNFAAMAVKSGECDAVIAGGVEHMTRVPMGADMGNPSPMLAERYPGLVPQGLSAEMIAEKWKYSRRRLDEFAARSQENAARAWKEGRFKNAIIPVVAKDDSGNEFVLEKDEHLRPGTTAEVLAGLQPSFKPDGVIHAGNSSGIVDGASAVLVMSDKKAKELGLRARARIVSTAVVGSEPIIMLTGPIPASQKALRKAGLKASDIDLVEINEAFAPVPLCTIEEVGFDPERVNVNGGAIALGHPLGATGGMLIGTLVDELERTGKRYGLVTMCIGFGMGTATIVERLN